MEVMDYCYITDVCRLCFCTVSCHERSPVSVPDSLQPTSRARHLDTTHGLVSAPLNALGKRLARAVEKVTSAENLTADQWFTLDLVVRSDGVPMNYLSRSLAIPSPTMTKFVDHLAGQALIFRLPDDLDRRRILVHASRRGSELHSALRPDVATAEQEVMSSLPPSVAAALSTLSEAVGESV